MENREECAPLGVTLVGSLSSPMSRRINQWEAFFGQTRICPVVPTKRRARAEAWKWHDRTTDEERAAMKARDATGVTADEWRAVVREILLGRSRNAKHLCERIAEMRDEEIIEVLTVLVERGGNDLGIIKGQTRIDLFANRC